MLAEATDLVAHSLLLGQRALDQRSDAARKQRGQFLTPPAIARYMARRLAPFAPASRVLEPAIGSGILACAVVQHAIEAGYPTELFIEGYEIDADLCNAARAALAAAARRAAEAGVRVRFSVHEADFILSSQAAPDPTPLFFSADPAGPERYTHVIANPPYFKLRKDDPRVHATAGHVAGHTNIYTLFMALASERLCVGGRACFIVPRSFCSGAYHAAFRQAFLLRNRPERVHLFESRKEAFKGDAVLQENIIFSFRKTDSRGNEAVRVSASRGIASAGASEIDRAVPEHVLIGARRGALFFRLPTSELDERILEAVEGWPGSLAQFGMAASTGPVVPFRARPLLTDEAAVSEGRAVPLLWMQHVRAGGVSWPASAGRKPQGLLLNEQAKKLLVPNANYVLLRRFSAKEEARRIIAAPLLREHFGAEHLGLENHLNYLYRKRGALTEVEAVGLAALLGSALIDRYIRITNGNTQVNAAELRALPLPPLDVIRCIGRRVAAASEASDRVVYTTLQARGHLPQDFPFFEETRYSMGKVQEAQDVLRTLGLPAKQQNEMAALTLLVLAQLSEDVPWSQAQRRSLRIHDMLGEMRARYDRAYAENTRETIRRQVIHQFEQAGVVVRNPDEPTLPTNSPRTHYALSDAAIRTLRAYRSSDWANAAQEFLENQQALIERYRWQRDQHKVPLMLDSGAEYHLSPGAHNVLQAAIIEEFGPRFAPGAKVLYVGDTADKTLHLDSPSFERLGIPVPSHDKLPDVVLYDERKKWLYFIEAVTSHGPLSPKRKVELHQLLAASDVSAVFVSAFPDFTTFKNFLSEIAWETEVWIADTPSHLIHFNGDRFLGPNT